MRRIYLDYASSTPMDKEVVEAMMLYFSDIFGNAGAAHQEGQKAQAAIFEARQKVADFFNCDFKEIFFTGSATESNNLAIRGIVKYAGFPASHIKPHIITSSIEHKSVLETCHDLERRGEAEVTYLPATKEGFVRSEDVKKALRENTVLVSIMYVNNEIGTIQPITEISKLLSDFRNSKHEARNSKQIQNSKKTNSKCLEFRNSDLDIVSNFEFRISNLKTDTPFFHTDAVQAVNYLDCDVAKLGIDLLSFSGHKIYGPKGIGGLYVRQGVEVAPIITGGNQERGLRSGTENVPYIAGLGNAIELASAWREEETKRLTELRDYFINRVLKEISSAELNGSRPEPEPSARYGAGDTRVANNANFLFRGASANSVLIALDQVGVAASSGSTCAIKTVTPSHVLLALGRSEEEASQSIRFTLGKATTKEDIDYVVSALENIINSSKKI